MLALGAIAGTHEATQFSVPAARPTKYVPGGAEFGARTVPTVESLLGFGKAGCAVISRVEATASSDPA